MRAARRSSSVLALGAMLVGAGLMLPGAATAAEPLVVSIRAELDLPEQPSSVGPIVFEVVDVVAGDGPELTAADEIENPSEWGGSIEVDVDPIAKTISVYSDPEDTWDFYTAKVWVTSPQIGAITLIEDTLFDQDLCPEDDEGDGEIISGTVNGVVPVALVDNGVWTFDYASAGGVVSLSWVVIDAYELGSLDTCGITVLSYADAIAPAALADTGSNDSLLIAGLGASILLLGVGAAAMSVTRRARTKQD